VGEIQTTPDDTGNNSGRQMVGTTGSLAEWMGTAGDVLAG